MKTRVALIFFSLVSIIPAINAQDVIIKVNGDEINAIIIEVDSSEVKYKRFDNESGPIYIIATSDIFMIKYENGEKDVFDVANPPVLNTLNYRYKNPAAAFGLSLLLPGLGQYYNGQIVKGIAMNVLTVGSFLTFWYHAIAYDKASMPSYVVYVGTYLWALIDAPVSANAINKRNQALSWNLGNDRKLSITPDVFVLSANPLGTKTKYQSPAYGLSLKLDF